ncbi:MAG4270 family putative restriction endonuclease [Mycoplasmopsis gallinacea]
MINIYLNILICINSIDNLFDMDPTTHSSFDKPEFTYDNDGEIVIYNSEVNDFIEKNYLKIPRNKLNKEIIKFIEKRNDFYKKKKQDLRIN